MTRRGKGREESTMSESQAGKDAAKEKRGHFTAGVQTLTSLLRSDPSANQTSPATKFESHGSIVEALPATTLETQVEEGPDSPPQPSFPHSPEEQTSPAPTQQTPPQSPISPHRPTSQTTFSEDMGLQALLRACESACVDLENVLARDVLAIPTARGGQFPTRSTVKFDFMFCTSAEMS